MTAANVLHFPERALSEASRRELIQMVLTLRVALERREAKIITLQEALAKRDAELEKLTKAKINQTVNQPSSKQRAAYYWPDKQRGSEVVAKILGGIFSGILVTDAWCAYMKIMCLRQTCMAHLFRKIRKFRDTYPQYYSIVSFYRKLKRILDDGERLKSTRKAVGEEVFTRRLGLLKVRLGQLLAWRNPNPVLQEVIAKVARQEEYILTFVEHDGVPSHNNYGEYIIKKGVLKRKVSGGSMSEDGVRAYAVIQSIAQTCHLRRLSFLGFLAQSLVRYIRTGKPLLLKQYEITTVEALKKAA